jgi:hypothetical protein
LMLRCSFGSIFLWPSGAINELVPHEAEYKAIRQLPTLRR